MSSSRRSASTSPSASASSRGPSASSGPTTCPRRARARSCAGCCATSPRAVSWATSPRSATRTSCRRWRPRSRSGKPRASEDISSFSTEEEAMSTTSIASYEEAVAQHEWRVPERYNIAQDVCDKHPADKLAMIHEDFEGNVREVRWGELQEMSNRFANVLRAHGVEKGDRVAMLLPPTPETAAAFFGTWKCGAILLSMSVLYGDDGIRHRVSDSQAKILLTNAANRDRVDPALVQDVLLLDDDLLAGGDPAFEPEDTL